MNAFSRLRHALRAFHGRQKGQILIMAALCMVALLGAAAIAIDIGRFVHGRQDIQNAVDAAALAAAQELPDHGETAEALANQYLDANDPDIAVDQRDITFRCIVGDRDGDGQPDAMDIPTVCNPGAGAQFTCHGSICISACDFSSPSNKCNTVVVGASKDVPFFIAPVLGIAQASTGDIRAAACRGVCGGPPTAPLDVVIVLDRTGSMGNNLNCGLPGTEKEMDCARQGARQVLELYNPAKQYIGLGLLGPSKSSTSCSGSHSPAKGLGASSTTDYNNGLWVPVGLTGVGAPVDEAYRNADGTLNTSSLLVKTIDTTPVGSTCLTSSSTGTNLAHAMMTAKDSLLNYNDPRGNVKKGIIFMTDGAPNNSGYGPSSEYTCQAAYNQAAAAKAAGIEIFTIGYGLSGDTCPDSSGTYHNQRVTKLLADMATVSVDETGCDNSSEAAQENADGDHFLCQPSGSDMSSLFSQAAVVLASGSRLIQVPD
jgi:hypothetical protein